MKKKAIVLGLGKSGTSAVTLLINHDFEVIAIDDFVDDHTFAEKKNLFPEVKVLREINEEDFNSTQLFILSPGIAWNHPAIVKAKKYKIEIIGEVELAFRILKPKCCCIGVTGTNGKTTVTLLIEHILKSNGINALAVGNIGLPVTSAFEMPNIDVFVIELSSFQLETISSKCLKYGIILNISPDHLDRYESIEAYANVKLKMLDLIEEDGCCYINERIEFAKKNNSFSYGFNENNHIYYKNGNIYIHNKLWINNDFLEKYNENHDLENILGSISICSNFSITKEKIINSIETFKKPSHRIEFVRNLNGVVYYNDSKGTNIDAVIKAVESIKKNIILICGGVDKGASYNIWRNVFMGKVKSILVIGQAAKKIAEELKDLFLIEIVSTLEEAVSLAYRMSKEGDSVLLSPGCSSYDMFLNYEHRGNEFVRIVNSLPNREKL